MSNYSVRYDAFLWDYVICFATVSLVLTDFSSSVLVPVNTIELKTYSMHNRWVDGFSDGLRVHVCNMNNQPAQPSPNV